ncbi:hemolysin III family protein [uncultured Boseongicola sp.]|jgi:hemolysin III|uniref:PAQR family membrane homeostasis protein TrhA n=1 Tax=uncultured Boseongicola sp. TaxID=1648499 RepID=UPI0026025786|nr:hemolysin III family protein [uncultured Boseongicola sp.]
MRVTEPRYAAAIHILLARRAGYTRTEYLSDLAVHLIGTIVILTFVPLLVVLAVVSAHGAASVIGMVLYGLSFAAMILCSAVYNIFPHPDWEWLFKWLDHSAIYLKIAGTFTGFAMIAGQGFVIVGALWAAAAGISLKMICRFRFRRTSIALYLGMGWAGGLVAFAIFAALPPLTGSLIVGGGLLYTVGTGFYLWLQLPFHLTIWHCFVLVASLAFYAAAVVAVLG